MTSRHLVHRPAARLPTLFAMALLAAVMMPAFVLGPRDAGMALGALVWALFEGFLATLLFQRVDVRVENGTLSFTHRRWPLGARTESVPLTSVKAAELETSRGRKGRAFRLVLKLHDGNTVPLTSAFFGRTSNQDRDLAALQQLIS